MVKIINREGMAELLNDRNIVVLPMDMADMNDEFEYVRCKVRIDMGQHIGKGSVIAWFDKREPRTIIITQKNACFKSNYEFLDDLERLEYAVAPLISKDCKIAIAIYDSDKGVAYKPVVVSLVNEVREHCSEPLQVENDIPVDLRGKLLIPLN